MSVRFRVFASGSLAGASPFGEPRRPPNVFYELFPVPVGKSVIVTAMRFVNASARPVPFTIALRKKGVNGVNGVTSTIFPDMQDWPLGSGQCAIEDREITLGVGESLWAKVGKQNDPDNAAYPGTVAFVITGVERDA